MSKPRPGVEAAKRLAKCTDEKIWGLVEVLYPDIVAEIDGLKEINEEYCSLGRSLSKDSSKMSITKDELFKVVNWKFKVGKPRNALMKHLRSNTETSVVENSANAIEKARRTAGTKMDLAKNALECLIKLNGVGPATASAILVLVQPDLFAYMYDEVIECFSPKRTYTLKTYISVNECCHEIASTLGNEWNPSRVARTLWIAARANAYNLHDHTLSMKRSSEENGTNCDEHKKRTTKRRRT
mmetsp:Transcript_16042/g.17957  ORF Transcript_16042/g.17957 Transcript_16042/m.17957 type:complete len:241 (-) Transcript_16042:40-762(-)